MSSQFLLQQAVSLHQAGRAAEAERLYAQVLKTDPKNFPAHYYLAMLFYQQQSQPEALRSIKTALKIDPNAGPALMLHGNLALTTGEYDAALSSFAKVTTREPGNAEAWHYHGMTLAALRRYEAAIASFGNALAVQPASVAALYHRGDALMELKRRDEAVAAFDAVLALAPNSFEAWNNRGLVLHEMHRFSEALESFERATALRPDDAGAWANRGKLSYSLDRVDEALASFDTSLALRPDNAPAWYGRGIVLRKLHRLQEAMECQEKALSVSEDFAEAELERGWLLCEMNRISDGLEVIRQSAERESKSGPTNLAEASAHKKSHDAEQRDYLAAQGVRLKNGDVHVAGGARLGAPAVNPVNAGSASAQWEESRPRLVVIDNLLTPDALEQLRRYCWGSTVWWRSYNDGYLGAMPEGGFACPLLAQIAEELRDTFPAIIGDHRLRMLWAFKYDSRLRGIRVHADQAAVNVNFWITPDEANLNAEGGGMVIWDKEAPPDWNIEKYNGDVPAVKAFLERSGAKAVKIPYRANRAVIFDSDLFHETDVIDFKEGYLNRRINVTMLYGRRTIHGR